MRFRLVDTAGRLVTEASYHGRWTLLYFGYTFCPDICPTALQAIATALDDLGPAANQVAALFVTIDPARDTPAALAQYAGLFSGGLTGLTGDAAQIEAAERQFDVHILEVTRGGPGDYSFLHSSSIYLLSPAGRLDAVFPAGTGAEALSAALVARVAAGDREG